jgi:hypothetical protein
MVFSHRFALEVDHIKAETILLDDPVDALVSWLAERLPGILDGTAVAHRDQELHHQTFKEGGGCRLDAVQEIRRERRLNLPVAREDQFLRRRLGGSCDLSSLLGLVAFLLTSVTALELHKLREPSQIPAVDPFTARHGLPASCRDANERAPRGFKQARLQEVGLRPPSPVVEEPLAAARIQFLPVSLSQAEAISDSRIRLADVVVPTVADGFKERPHELLVAGNGHRVGL